MDLLRSLDDRLLLEVNALARATDWLHPVLAGYANDGVVLIAVLLLAGVGAARTAPSRTLAAAGWAGLATLLAVAANQPLVHLVHEARPYTSHPGLLVLAHRSSDPSFPSDHAVMAGAAATGLLLVSRRIGGIALAAALVMAAARVYIAAHYPWDVAAGLAFGAAVTAAGWLLLGRPLTILTSWLRARHPLRRAFSPARRAIPPEPVGAPALGGQS